MLLARDVLREHPGATIIADVKASQVLFDEVARAGGNPLMWRTGHSLIKAKMAETGSPLAGEMSGHIFFADRWYGFDDALYAAVRTLGVLARMDGKLSAVRDALPQVINTPEVRFDCDDTRKFAVIEEVAARLRAEGAQGVGDRRRAGADRRWLVAAARVEHAGGAGGARRGGDRGGAGAAEAGAGAAARSVRACRRRISPAATRGTDPRRPWRETTWVDCPLHCCHGRACPGHPRLASSHGCKAVDGRATPSHDSLHPAWLGESRTVANSR